MERKKVAIIVGHEMKRKGASLAKTVSSNPVYEYDYNTEVAENILKFASNSEFEIKIFKRDLVGIRGVKDAVRKWAPICAIELHFDAALDNSVKGCTILTAAKFKDDLLPKKLLEKCVELFGGKNRGVKVPSAKENGYFNVLSTVPTFLIEPFFGSNTEQAFLALEKKIDYAYLILEALEETYCESQPQRIT